MLGSWSWGELFLLSNTPPGYPLNNCRSTFRASSATVMLGTQRGKGNLCKQAQSISEMGEGRRTLILSFVELPEGRKALDRRTHFRNYLSSVPARYEGDKHMPRGLKDQAK